MAQYDLVSHDTVKMWLSMKELLMLKVALTNAEKEIEDVNFDDLLETVQDAIDDLEE